MANRKKIGLIGAGNIGGELARLAANAELGDVVLFDIPAKENFAKGKALDLEQNSSVLGYDARITGSGNWADLEGSDVLVITAGIPRKPGQSRDDLVATNLPIIRDVANNAKKHCPNAFVIVISNPLDAMVYEYKRVTGCPKGMVAGMAGVLDSARFQLFLAREANVSIKDVRAMVLGGHGDDMVPVLSMCTINGVPATQFIKADKMNAIIERTRKGGGEIVNLMGTSAYYAPASSAIAMARAYLGDQKRLLACAAYLDGEYGYKDLFMGVPAIIGKGGVEKIIELPLSAEEKGMLEKSAKSVQSVVDVCKNPEVKVAALELPARFDRVAENLERVDSLLANAPCDLALLPEASLTGYVSKEGDFDLGRFAEPRDGPTARALAGLAKKHARHLVGPLVERAGNCVYNAMIGFDPTGREFVHYRKRHPWYPETWATPGDAPHPLVKIGSLSVTLATCFDVHFAEWPKADVLLFPSAWVEEEDSRLELLGKLGMHVVNANWGVGEPRLPGQGNSCILHASGAVVARGGPRIDAELHALSDSR